MDQTPFLRAFGRRVRELREGAGLGVQEAAQSAGVSRRTWTEIEAGRANPSLALLARVAEALSATPSGLLAGLERKKSAARVALLGLRGAGKSTVGRALARALEVPFVELDERVESLAGMPLGEVFALHGAEAFHRYEAEALEDVLAEGSLVLAAGGSLVDAPATFARLRATCRTVWLQATPEAHFQRVLDQGDRRPTANRPRAMEELVQLLRAREPLYAACERGLATDGRRPEDLAQELRAWLTASDLPGQGM